MTQIVADPDRARMVRMGDPRRWRCEGAHRRDRQPEPADRRIEVFARDIEVLSKASELPLPVFGEPDYPEDMRLKYRFLDLRRETLHANIMKRTNHLATMREAWQAPALPSLPRRS
jgi:aspartyl-tRNA synthetase